MIESAKRDALIVGEPSVSVRGSVCGDTRVDFLGQCRINRRRSQRLKFLGQLFAEHARDERKPFLHPLDRVVCFLRFAHLGVGETEPDPWRGVAGVDRDGFRVGLHGEVVLCLKVVDVAEIVPGDDEVRFQGYGFLVRADGIIVFAAGASASARLHQVWASPGRVVRSSKHVEINSVYLPCLL